MVAYDLRYQVSDKLAPFWPKYEDILIMYCY